MAAEFGQLSGRFFLSPSLLQAAYFLQPGLRRWHALVGHGVRRRGVFGERCGRGGRTFACGSSLIFGSGGGRNFGGFGVFLAVGIGHVVDGGW